MDFFARQDDAQSRSRAFFIAFGLSIALAVVVFYFVVTGCLMLLGGVGSALPRYGAEAGLLDRLIQGLPAFIYGSPARVLALKPFLILGSMITVFILGFSYYKTWKIKEGGGAYIAEALGGKLVEKPITPAEKQLVNVIEEMAVAAGLPRPSIYILTQERSINAITAGLDHGDAIIAVTQGTLNHLTRDELQGVVAHEFAHILNGDYALNMKMAGWLFGLLFFSVQGRDMLSLAGEMMETTDSSGRTSGLIYMGLPFLGMGLILLVGGWLGKLAAELVQAAFSRQREHLADAFAVQFTRNPAGLAGALKKIAALPKRGALRSGQALMMRSFFIVSPAQAHDLWRSHPPLEDRILTLEPSWDGTVPEVDYAKYEPPMPWGRLLGDSAPMPLPAFTPAGKRQLIERAGNLDTWTGALVLGLLSAGGAGLEPKRVLPDLAGPADPAGQSLSAAQKLFAEIPESLRGAADDPARVPALVAAVFLHHDPGLKEAQRKIITGLLNAETAARAFEYKAILKEEMRLPLLGLVSPTLKLIDQACRDQLGRTVKALAAADGKLDLFEIAALQILKKPLGLAPPASSGTGMNAPGDYVKMLQEDVVTVLSILAHVGTEDYEEARLAFSAGLVHFNQWPSFAIAPAEVATARELSRALDRLGNAPERIKKLLVLATVTTALHDHQVTQKEYELLRALAAALDTPLPLSALGK